MINKAIDKHFSTLDGNNDNVKHKTSKQHIANLVHASMDEHIRHNSHTLHQAAHRQDMNALWR